MRKLTVLLTALVFAGCSTDDAADIPSGMLKRVIVTPFAADLKYTARYYYDGHKLDRIENSNDTKEIYYYDGNLIVNVKRYKDTDLVEERRYQYDESDELVQSEKLDYLNDYNLRKIYAYNGDGSVTATIYQFDGLTQTPGGTRQFFFLNGELDHDVMSWPSGYVYTTTYTYDGNLVPEHGITGFDKIRKFDPETYKGVYHNIVNVQQANSSNADVQTYSHIWQYNDQGAPTYFSYDDQGTIVIDGGTVEYFYK